MASQNLSSSSAEDLSNKPASKKNLLEEKKEELKVPELGQITEFNEPKSKFSGSSEGDFMVVPGI